MAKINSASTLRAPHTINLREKPLRRHAGESPSIQKAGQPKVTRHIVQLAVILSMIFLTAVAARLGCFPELSEAPFTASGITAANRAVDASEPASLITPKQKAEELNAQGVSLLGKDQEGAIDCFRRAVDTDPNFVAAYNNLGAALLESGDSQEAKSAFASAVKLQPSNVYASRQLASLTESKN